MEDEIQKEELRKQVDEARDMRDFSSSAQGQQFVALLKREYEALIMQAVSESKFFPALKALEHFATRIGVTLKTGQAALERLERVALEIPEEEF